MWEIFYYTFPDGAPSHEALSLVAMAMALPSDCHLFILVLSDLDFSPRIRLMEHVRAKFSTSITPPPNAAGFILVLSFSCSSVHLNEDSVALVL
jgi:hypothetical protein